MTPPDKTRPLDAKVRQMEDLWFDGRNTYEIAVALKIPEHEVERALHRLWSV